MADGINNNGAEALVARIIAEAEADAATALAAASSEIEAIAARGEKRADAVRIQGAESAAKKRADAVERGRTGGELEVRKLTLKNRREKLGEAFDEAYKELCALSGGRRDRLLLGAAVREADGGEAVIASAADKQALTRLLPDINKALAESGRAALTLAGGESGGDNGFVLKAAGYEKNCSLAAMLEDARSREESAVFGVLFGAGR